MLGDANARLGSILDDRDINGVLVSNKNKPLLLGFLDYTGLQVLNKLFTKGISTYEIVNRRRIIIDLCLTNSVSIVHNFQVLPLIMGVDLQTCHKIIKLELYLGGEQEAPTKVPKIKRFRHYSFSKLEEVRDYVYSKLELIRSIKEQCGLQLVPNYKMFRKLYTKAKERILGYKRYKRKIPWAISPRIRSLQKLIRDATVDVKMKKSDSGILKLQNLEHLIKREYYKEKNERFSKWLEFLSKLHYKRRTRTFFMELRKTQNGTENFSPIKNSLGKLSTNWTESLENWASFYASLYSDTAPSSPLNPPYKKNDSLDEDFSIEELISAVDTLKEHKAPGTDNILGEDFLILLRADYEEIHSAMKNVELLKTIHAVISSFWKREKVPPPLKKSILRPFLKGMEDDATNPENYRPISLLNT